MFFTVVFFSQSQHRFTFHTLQLYGARAPFIAPMANRSSQVKSRRRLRSSDEPLCMYMYVYSFKTVDKSQHWQYRQCPYHSGNTITTFQQLL